MKRNILCCAKGPCQVATARWISKVVPGGSKRQDRRAHYQIVQPGVVSPEKDIPEFISRPNYNTAVLGKSGFRDDITINSEELIRKMRQTCALAKHVLETAGSAIKPGITTDEIDVIVHNEVIRCGAYPSTLFYKGFPKSCCTSVNNVVCHGIPDNTVLQDGDIVNVDITVFYLGCHGDTSDTFQVGYVDSSTKHLISTTQKALHNGIKVCKPGAKFSSIPYAIEPFANSNGLKVCRRFVGHGIGERFHSPPNIWHTRTLFADNRKMKPGMIFTIEPILMEGDDAIKILSDGWTAVSKDNLRSAQAEHTILITPDGCDILTL